MTIEWIQLRSFTDPALTFDDAETRAGLKFYFLANQQLMSPSLAMMRRRVVLSAVALAAAAYTGLSAYVIANQSIEHLLICADSGGLRVPFSKSVCRGYLFAFRGTKDDIDALHQGIGASFVVQGKSTEDEREQVLKFLVGKGLDVNHEDAHRLTPLHGAVLANSPGEVGMLLRNGADARLQDRRFGLTPLELAVKLQREGAAAADRQGVIALLKGAR